MTLDIGLVGVGRWGSLILRDLGDLGANVHAVARSDASVERATRGGAASIVGSTTELPAVHGAVVATPTTRHYDTCLELLDRDIPLFVEKPLTDSYEAARALAQAAGERVFVMDKWRYHRGVGALAALARSGELGAVTALRCTRVGWRTKSPDTDVLWYLAPHDLSIALEILGVVPQPTSVATDWAGSEMVGALAVFEGPPQLIIEVSERSVDRVRRIELTCEGGTALLRDSYSPDIEVYRYGSPLPNAVPVAEHRAVANDLPLRAELGAFLDHCRGGPAPKSSCAEAVMLIERLQQLHDLDRTR